MSIRILCYGDSLTAGYCGSPGEYHPYAARLSPKVGANVDQVGMSGWRVDQMLSNKDNACGVDIFNKCGPGLTVQLDRQKYDFCILMGGTNDLGANRSADEILRDLKALHGQCHVRGVRTIAISIPENRFIYEGFYQLQASTRRKVNHGLKQWAMSMSDKMIFVDMASQLPFSHASGDWHQDGLHMTRQGYQRFGDCLANLIRPFVNSGAKGSSLPMVDVTNFNRIAGPTAFLGAVNSVPFGPPTTTYTKMVAAEKQNQFFTMQPTGLPVGTPIIW